MIVLFLIFEGNLLLFSIVAAPIYILTNSVQDVLYSIMSLTFIFFSKAILTDMLWYFILVLIYFALTISDMSIGHFYILFGEMSIQFFCLFFNWVICFMLLSYQSSLYILLAILFVFSSIS